MENQTHAGRTAIVLIVMVVLAGFALTLSPQNVKSGWQDLFGKIGQVMFGPYISKSN